MCLSEAQKSESQNHELYINRTKNSTERARKNSKGYEYREQHVDTSKTSLSNQEKCLIGFVNDLRSICDKHFKEIRVLAPV